MSAIQNDSSNDVQLFQSMQNEADKIRKLIKKTQDNLVKFKFDLNLNLILFILITFVLVVFLIIVINDLFNILSLYLKKKRFVSKSDKYKNRDDYESYNNPLIVEKNELDEIESNIMIQKKNQNSNFDKIREFKKANNLPTSDKVEAQVDLTVLNQNFDDYHYDKSKNGFSFWEMLIMPPDFSQLVTKKENVKPYIQF